MLFYDANSSNHAANELASEIDTKFLSSSFPSSPLGLVKLNSCVFSFNFSAKKERKEERKRESLVYIYTFVCKTGGYRNGGRSKEARLKNISLAHNKIGEEREKRNRHAVIFSWSHARCGLFKKKKKILRIKRSRLELGDGERALIKESFPASSPSVSRELCGPNEPHPLRKSHHQSLLFPRKKSPHDFARLFPRLRVIFTVSRPIPPSQNFISWRAVGVDAIPIPRKIEFFWLSLERGGIETNVAKDKRRVKDPRNDVRPRLIWHEFPKTSTGLSRLSR